MQHEITSYEIQIQTPKAVIRADLRVPDDAVGLILFAHGAGSSRHSRRNRAVAEVLQQGGFATLLADLISDDEDRRDVSGRLRLDIPFLAGRVDAVTQWVLSRGRLSRLPIGYYGADTGAAAALLASLQRPQAVGAIVCRGGRPGLVERILPDVRPPTLLIVGEDDTTVREENQRAYRKLNTGKNFTVIPGAAHLFEEPGKLEAVADVSKSWFEACLAASDDPDEALPLINILS